MRFGYFVLSNEEETTHEVVVRNLSTGQVVRQVTLRPGNEYVVQPLKEGTTKHRDRTCIFVNRDEQRAIVKFTDTKRQGIIDNLGDLISS